MRICRMSKFDITAQTEGLKRIINAKMRYSVSGRKGRIKISQTSLLAENVTLWERKTISTDYNQHRVKFGGFHGEYKDIVLNLAP